MDELKISPITFNNIAYAENIVRMGIRAWGKKPDEQKIAKRIDALNKEIKNLDPKHKCLFVAYLDKEIAGFIQVVLDAHDDTVWWLQGIVVDPVYQRRGIGKQLVDACVEYAKNRDGRLLRSETHLDNIVSIAFHESIGFINDGTFTAPDGDIKVAFSFAL